MTVEEKLTHDLLHCIEYAMKRSRSEWIISKGGYSLEINGEDVTLSDPDEINFKIGKADLLELLSKLIKASLSSSLVS